MSDPDRRLNAYRPDLAASYLRNVVVAEHYTDGSPARIVRPVVPVRREPDPVLPRDTEYLFGESVTVLDTSAAWAWVQSQRDRYVGYIDADALAYDAPDPTHRVTAVNSHVYPAPELKRFAVTALPFGAEVTVVETNDRWAQIADGQWIYAAHLTPLIHRENDPAATALRFLEVPYLWGGRSSAGMDCSALIQFALQACGIPCPRDSDMQERDLGRPVDRDEGLRRGDIIFWPGHCGMMTDGAQIVHCNATDMATRVWTLAELEAHILRIEQSPIRCVKRL